MDSRDRPAARPKEKGDDLPTFWFPHAAEGYVLGDVLHLDGASDTMHVRLHNSDRTNNFHATVAKPVNPKMLDGVDDNTQLMHLHEPSLLSSDHDYIPVTPNY